jgi:two-component system response regulator RegA
MAIESHEEASRISSDSLADLAPGPCALGAGEIRTAIYVYGRTTLTIECAELTCLSAFQGTTPDVYLDTGTHRVAVEPGVYLVHGGPGIEVAGDDADVITIQGGRPARRTPRRLFKVLPSIERRALARFLRRPAAEPPRPRRAICRILAVDEDEAATGRYVRGFGPARTVIATGDPAVARMIAKTAPCDLAIVELRIKDESGIELARELKREQPGLVVALCSGYLSVEIAVAALHAGIDIVLFKPVSAQEILRRIDGGATDEPSPEDTTTLEHAEWEHIGRVLAACNGNISLAATRLGIYRSSLQRRLRKSGPIPIPTSTR